MSWKKSIIDTLMVAWSLVVLAGPTKCQKLTGIHDRKVGESCERDIQCIRHAYCRYQLTCMCDGYYAPSLDKASCHVTAGASCFDPEGCSSMANAECRQNVCTCKDSYMIDINNSSNCIIRPTRDGQFCQRNDDCSDSMEKSYCINNKCTCYTDYRFVNQTGTCLKTRGLYQPCKKDYECFLDKENPGALECKNGECACRKGETSCNKAGATYQSIFGVLSTVALGTGLWTLI